VLGLADEVDRDESIRVLVGDDEDLGRAGLRIRADDAADGALGGATKLLPGR
jgi:hypothetical protein